MLVASIAIVILCKYVLSVTVRGAFVVVFFIFFLSGFLYFLLEVGLSPLPLACCVTYVRLCHPLCVKYIVVVASLL